LASIENMEYFVVGLRNLTGKAEVAFFESRSSKPADDVEQALAVGCDYVLVRLLDGEGSKELSRYVDMLRSQGTRNKVSEQSSPRRLKGGKLTYNVIGLAPDIGRISPETGRNLYKSSFVQQVSVTPADDAKRALRAGSVTVRIEVNYELSEDEKLEQEEDRQRLAELKRSEARLKTELIRASSPDARHQYVVVGFAKGPKGEVNAGRYLMPLTSTPGKEVEQALRLRCHWITVSLLAGRPELARALVKNEDSFGDGKARGYSYESFPVPQPQLNNEPSIEDGLTICRIVGAAQDIGNGSSRALWRKDDSITPADDVELAIRAGSTEIIVEVTRWGKADYPLN
jgi:hypothetical protein